MTQKLNEQINLRGMLAFKRAKQPVPLDEARQQLPFCFVAFCALCVKFCPWGGTVHASQCCCCMWPLKVMRSSMDCCNVCPVYSGFP